MTAALGFCCAHQGSAARTGANHNPGAAALHPGLSNLSRSGSMRRAMSFLSTCFTAPSQRTEPASSPKAAAQKKASAMCRRIALPRPAVSGGHRGLGLCEPAQPDRNRVARIYTLPNPRGSLRDGSRVRKNQSGIEHRRGLLNQRSNILILLRELHSDKRLPERFPTKKIRQELRICLIPSLWSSAAPPRPHVWRN